MKVRTYQDIPDSEDWRTDTDDPMVNAFREQMIYNNQFVDDPYVGIFFGMTQMKICFSVFILHLRLILIITLQKFLMLTLVLARRCIIRCGQKSSTSGERTLNLWGIIQKFREDRYLRWRIEVSLYV